MSAFTSAVIFVLIVEILFALFVIAVVLLFIDAKLDRIEHNKAFIHANLSANDILCAEFTGCFVQVKEDHPAYHRW